MIRIFHFRQGGLLMNIEPINESIAESLHSMLIVMPMRSGAHIAVVITMLVLEVN